MKKAELKTIIKDMRGRHKADERTDQTLHIVTDGNQYYCINEYEELPAKVSINKIAVAIFQGSDGRGIYLKNGLESYRGVRKHNIV